MILYKTGNALDIDPAFDTTVIIHCCNDQNAFGAGFARAITKKFPIVKSAYHDWFRDEDFKIPDWTSTTAEPDLGECQNVFLESEGKRVIVINMIGQKGYGSSGGKRYVKYDSLLQCLEHVKRVAEGIRGSYTIQAPRFGSGLAGGDWKVIEALIKSVGLDITIYDL
jgi:hypothetical protein